MYIVLYCNEFLNINFFSMQRSRSYEFGVGRRSKAYSFGVGKRFNYDDQPLDYESDVAYDSNPSELEDNQSQYKRGPSQGFSFGVGKRESETTSSNSAYMANKMKKPKNSTYDVNLYEVYNLMRKLNKMDALV